MRQASLPPSAAESAARKELRAQNRDPRVFVRRGTYGGPRFVLYSADDRIEVGRYCSIAGGSHIMGGGEHNYRTASSFPFYWYHGEEPEAELEDPALHRYRTAVHKGPTVVGNDVWIGYESIILPGVRVGHGAVIGAGAVVASEVEPYAIVVGNPARCLKKRFADEYVARLLEVRWWDWRPEHVYKYQGLLHSDPAEFLAAVDALEPAALAAMYEEDPLGLDLAYRPPEPEPAPRPAPAHPLKRLARQLVPPALYSALSRVRR